MGFNKLFWGFLFFFDFRLQGVDVLPDVIGYVLMYIGLTELMARSTYFQTGRILAIPLAFISIFNIYQVQQPGVHVNLGSSLGMLVGVVTFIVDLFLVYYITHGIMEMAEGQGEYVLKDTALTRWKYYMFLQIGGMLSLILGFLAVPLVVIIIIPLFIFSIIVFVLMMKLMKQAEETLA